MKMMLTYDSKEYLCVMTHSHDLTNLDVAMNVMIHVMILAILNHDSFLLVVMTMMMVVTTLRDDDNGCDKDEEEDDR